MDNQNQIVWKRIKKDLLVFIQELLSDPKGVFTTSVILSNLERELKTAIGHSNNEDNLYISVCTIGNLWDCCEKLGLFSDEIIEKIYNILGNYRMNYRFMTNDRVAKESFKI